MMENKRYLTEFLYHFLVFSRIHSLAFKQETHRVARRSVDTRSEGIVEMLRLEKNSEFMGNPNAIS